MADTDLEPPFQAYTGTEPFIFVSYSHKDADAVFAELNELHDLGYRIWFDEGIDPGNEWPEEIANALMRSALFLVFITPNAVASRNVRNEIQLALHLDKSFLAVHICDTQLPAGLQLNIGALQAVLKFRMSHQNYRRKMEKALPSIFRHTPTVRPPQETEPNKVNQGNSPKGVSLVRDYVSGRYRRPLVQVIIAARTVFADDGKVLEDETTDNILQGEVNQCRICLKATAVNDAVCDITIQARTIAGEFDHELSNEYLKKIALAL